MSKCLTTPFHFVNPWHNPMTRKIAFLSCLAITLVIAASADAATAVISPSADTTIQSAFAGNNFGGGLSITAGGRRNGEPRADYCCSISPRIFLRAPPSAHVSEPACRKHPFWGPNSTFDLNRILDSWGEGVGSDRGGSPATANQSTWNSRFFSSTLWTTPGGDFSSSLSASRLINGNGSYVFNSTPNLVSDVQSWLESPSANFGWMLRSESEATAASIRRFGSRGAGANSPTLTVIYSVPEPGTASLALLAFGISWRAKRRT